MGLYDQLKFKSARINISHAAENQGFHIYYDQFTLANKNRESQ